MKNTTPLNEIFRTNLKNYLKFHKMSQKCLAGKMKVVPQALNKYIKGQRKPGIDTIENISRALEINPCELLIPAGEEPKLVSTFIAKNKIDSKTFEKLFFSINNVSDFDKLIEEVNKFGGWPYLLNYISEENIIKEKSHQEYNKVKYKIIKSMKNKGYDV